MPTYHVHCYVIVRVLVPNVEAESHREAAEKAADAFDWDNPAFGACREFADDFHSFLVDVAGADDYGDSQSFHGDFGDFVPAAAETTNQAVAGKNVEPYTVVGFWNDNGQPWVEHTTAGFPQSAITEALKALAVREARAGETACESLQRIRDHIRVVALFPGKLRSLF